MKNNLENSVKPKYWHDLTEEEKRAIHNPQDYPVISVVKAIPQDISSKLDKLLAALSNDKSFNYEELPWVKDFLWYKGEKGREEGVSWNRMCIEYRLYYAAKHPDRIKNPSNLKIKRFLKWIALGKEYYKPQLD